MDMPTFEDVGASAYQDFTQGGQLPALMDSPLRGEVLPPQEDGGVGAAEAAAAELIAAAEKQRQLAGNPLHRGLSVLGGVIGAPFNFLGAALGGGDMTDVTAPFRPQQQADMRFQQMRMGIEDKLADIRKDYASMDNSRAAAMRQALGMERDDEQAGRDDLGRLTSSMLFMDEPARRQRMPALLALARRHPDLVNDVQDLIDGGFDDASLAAMAAMSQDEGARQRGNQFLYGGDTVSLGDGVGVRIAGRPGTAPQVFSLEPGTNSVTANAPIGGRSMVSDAPALAPAPAPAPAATITPEQYKANVEGMGQERADAWMQRNGITVAPAGEAAPSLNDIDAELRRRGVL